MKFEYKVKFENFEIWQEWLDTYIGKKGVDYFFVTEPYIENFDDGSSIQGANVYIEVPDAKKSVLWALTWS